MEQDSLLEDITNQTPNPTPYYRFVGIIRLIYTLLLITAAVANLITLVTIIMYGNLGDQSTALKIEHLFTKFAPTVIYTLMLIYYVPQVRYELALSSKLFQKRPFRLYTVVLNIIFIVALLFSIIVNNRIIHLGTIFTLSMVVFALLNALLVYTDIKLLRGQKSFMNIDGK
jgi:hypothetical protein